MSALEHRHIASGYKVKGEDGIVNDALSAPGLRSSAEPIGECRTSLGLPNSGEAFIS